MIISCRINSEVLHSLCWNEEDQIARKNDEERKTYIYIYISRETQ